jgi:outer membrane protein assembly factor BamB
VDGACADPDREPPPRPSRRREVPRRGPPLGARPIAWDGNVLVPGADGRIYLIDPGTGDSAADPFVPRFDKEHPSRWLSPTLVEENAVALADEEGHVRRIIRAETPRRRLVIAGETSLGKSIDVDPASTGASVVVATVDGKVRALAARDLSPINTVDLPAPRSFGPISVGDHGFVADGAGDVFVFGPDGRKAWQTKLSSALNEAPAVRAGAAWFLSRSGALEARSLSDGASSERLTLGVLPAGPPIASGGRIVVPTGLGSFRVIAE